MKAYLVAINGLPSMCCTSEDEADVILSKMSSNANTFKIPVDLEVDNDTIIQLTQNVLDDVEEMLEKKEIKISDRCRENEESEACLFGETYYDLEDKINNTISEMFR